MVGGVTWRQAIRHLEDSGLVKQLREKSGSRVMKTDIRTGLKNRQSRSTTFMLLRPLCRPRSRGVPSGRS